MLTLPNYQIGTQIYESANSLVYRGVRKKDNQPVILKMLKEDYPTPAELTRYRQEYEIIHDLDLAGVINAYGIEKCQNTLVIIFQDLGGESLKQLMATRPLTLNEFLPLAIQITDSLGNIHAANLIHKDINPSNIVVNPETKQLKIIDFGIASRLPRENPTLKTPEQLEGTLAYISPEQTGRINRSLDYRTDLYSLGVTFYELLTGVVPFAATDAMELVHCHLAKTPTPLCEFNSDIPLIVSDIILKLLAKNAEDRYQSAFGVKADLENCLALSKKVFGNKLFSTQFQLAQNDFSGKLQIPQKLYGREHEINTLLQAFERVSGGATEMMLVAGYSGVGKTALVREVHKPMTSKRGYFAAGKFDQFQKNIPYSAITQAFNEFCRYLLMESAENLANWQRQILFAVGNNGQIIIDVIPDLELVIGPQPAVAEVGPTEAQNRFLMFFLNFVKALCDKDHPFILFIDDLQWVDLASLGLLKSMMLDDEIQHLLIIGAYRDNEVDSTHPFMMALSELEKANATINTIFLANLQQEDVNQLLQDSLSCETALTQPLSDLIYQKTQGNAFFTHQFLQALYFEALLRFEQHQWIWDVEKIAAQNITDNVVELMANKIGNLPLKTSKVLQLAACIGNQFDLPILAIIYEQDQNETLEVLHPAMTEGLIQPLDENYKHIETASESQFKFLHDRVQQAAYALIDDEQKQAVHLQIGRLLLEKTPTETLAEKVFEIVGQFNQSLELLNNQAERLKVAELNFMAGQKAKMATAYGAAINYFTKGRACLTESSWDRSYDLTLNLFTGTLEVAYLSGDFEQMEQLAQAVLQQARTVSDETKICEIQIQAYIAQNQIQKAIKIALIFLNRLGINLPEEPTQEDVGLALQKTQASLADKPIQSFIDLPMMTDTHKILVMRIMVVTIPAAYHVSPSLMILLVLKQVDLSLEYGNVAESCFAYVTYGLVLCGVVFDIDSGYQFGQLALNLLKRLEVTELKAKVMLPFNVFIRSWKEHLKETLQPLLELYQICLETGNIEFVAYSTEDYSYYSFFTGKSLVTLELEIAQYNQVVAKIKQEHVLSWNNLLRQVVLNLMGYSNEPCRLIGEVYNEKIQLERYQQANDNNGIHYLHLSKCILHYLFQEYAPAVENAEIAEQHLDGVISMLEVAIFHFYDSLARLALYPSLPKPSQEAVLTKVSGNQEKMLNWASHAPMNFQHKYDLVKAEKARVLEQDLVAMDYYEKAIAGAFDNEYINEEALAYELAAKFYLGRGMEKIAQTYLKEAHYRYQQWGAVAKVKDLEERYPKWLTKESTPAIPFTSSQTILASTRTSPWLDLESVMKASQTLSGEIVLKRLLEKMMQIVIENAGAQHGFLILPRAEKWVIEAEGAIDKEEVTVLHSLPVSHHLPEVIVNYVARTFENVVLADAEHEGIYTENAYIKAHQTQSVLCFPIVYQQQLRAILYFENNLTTGAFTPQRLSVLQMLSSQIAISLENAQYATQLEGKVKQRTKQLATANQEITLLNEQLKEENLRMSAELNVSRQLQQMLLPTKTELEQIECLDIAGFMEPADEVGGDYYDVLQYSGGILFAIGDVTGHGLESGALSMMVQSAVRSLLAYDQTEPVHFLNALNQMVFHNVVRMNVEKNLTLALLSYQDGELSLTGQHEEIIVVRQGKVELIDTMELGFYIGLEEDIAQFVHQATVPLNAGDVVVLYTDGITEAFNMKKTEYGLERLCEIIQQNWQQTAQEIQQAVINDVRQFIGEQKVFDDITLLVLKQQ